MNFSYFIVFVLIVLAIRKIKILNYKVKLIGYYVMVSAILTAYIPFFLFRPRNVQNLHYVSRSLRHIKRLYGVQINIKGSEFLRKDGSAVVVANHQSSLDILAMFDIWFVTLKMTVLAKRELIYLGGTFGLGAWLAGMKFINRSAGGKVGESMNATMMELKNKHEKLWIFPEGTRRNTGEIHEFKKGAFHTAIHAQVPIIPVVYGSYKFMFDSDRALFEAGNINIVVLPEISTIGLTAKDVDALIKQTRDVMINAYEEMSEKNSNKID